MCAEIGKAISADDVVVNEAVTRQSIPNLQIARPKPGTMISNAGGGLGASGGTALGIKLALPDRCVVQIVGDGSFYFNNPTAVFAVAKQYRLPIFTVSSRQFRMGRGEGCNPARLSARPSEIQGLISG